MVHSTFDGELGLQKRDSGVPWRTAEPSPSGRAGPRARPAMLEMNMTPGNAWGQGSLFTPLGGKRAGGMIESK